MNADTTVQTIVDLSINNKYTTLDNDKLKVFESNNQDRPTNQLQIKVTLTALARMMATIKFYLSNSNITTTFL